MAIRLGEAAKGLMSCVNGQPICTCTMRAVRADALWGWRSVPAHRGVTGPSDARSRQIFWSSETSVPDDWTCDPERYGDEKCDCLCGAWVCAAP